MAMLWFDNDPKASVQEKIEKAAEYYLGKYGENPNVCSVNPSMFSVRRAEQVSDDLKIQLSEDPKISNNHFYIR